MKKLLFLFFFLLVVEQINAQAIFDFNTKKTNDTLKLRHGLRASLDIQNINRFVHKAEINTTNVEYISVPSKSLSTLFGVAVDSAVASTEKAANNMSEANKNAKNAKTVGPDLSEFKRIMDSLIDNCNAYLNAINDIESLQKVNNILIRISKDASNYNEEMMKSAMDANEVDRSLADAKLEEENFERFYKIARKSYQIALKEAKNADLKDTTLIKNEGKSIEISYQKLEKALDSLNLETTLLKQRLLDVNSYIIRSEGKTATGDEIEFSVKVDNEILPPFVYVTVGGIKIDYSVGPMISFGKNAQNEIPYFKKLTDSTETLETKFSENRASLGLASYLHISKRTANYARAGLLIGITTDLKDLTKIETNFAIGLTVILGKKTNLISLATGVNLNRVDRLNEKQFIKGSTYKKGSQALETTLDKVFKPSLFFSVSYILPKRKTS